MLRLQGKGQNAQKPHPGAPKWRSMSQVPFLGLIAGTSAVAAKAENLVLAIAMHSLHQTKDLLFEFRCAKYLVPWRFIAD